MKIVTIRMSEETLKKIEEINNTFNDLGVNQTKSGIIKTCINIVHNEIKNKQYNPWKTK